MMNCVPFSLKWQRGVGQAIDSDYHSCIDPTGVWPKKEETQAGDREVSFTLLIFLCWFKLFSKAGSKYLLCAP